MASKKVSVSPEFLDGVVDIVQFTDSLMKKQAAYDEALPALVDSLVEHGVVSETKKAEVLKKMKDPKYLTQSFSKVAGHVRPPSLGEGHDPKEGSVKTDNKRESDRVFEEMILGRRGKRSDW